MTVLVFGSMRFPVENLDAVRRPLQDLCETTRREDGCVAYDVAEDLFEPGLIRFSEIWPDAASLTEHLNAPHIVPWRTLAAKLGVHDRNFTAYDAGNTWPV